MEIDRYTIDVLDSGNVIVNSTYHKFKHEMSDDPDTNFDMKAVAALINEMEYELLPFLEAMVDKLKEVNQEVSRSKTLF